MRLLFTFAALYFAVAASANTAKEGATQPWRLTGDFYEACTCSVPCPCNFGQSPSPHPFCYALWSLDIKDGHYGSTDLSGLKLATGNGAKGGVFYVDESATAEQASALKAIGETMWKSAARARVISKQASSAPTAPSAASR